MGSPCRAVPRLLVLAGTVAVVALVLTSRGAGANQPDPLLAPLVDQVGGTLSAQPVQQVSADPVGTLTGPLQPATATLSQPQSSAPATPPADPPSTPAPSNPGPGPIQSLTAPLQPVTTAAAHVLDPQPPAGTAGTVGAASPSTPSGPGPVSPTNLGGGGALFTPPTLPALDSAVAPITGATTPITQVLATGGPDVPALPFPDLGSVPLAALAESSALRGLPGFETFVRSAGVPPMELPHLALFPPLPASPATPPMPAAPGPSPVFPLPASLPAAVAAAPAGSAPQLALGAAGIADRVVTLAWLSSPPTGSWLTAGEAFLADPTAGASPARGPPAGEPRDPSHRGSTQNTVSTLYSILPGTDHLGVTRGESWHPGNEAWLSNPQPEPSVSPD